MPEITNDLNDEDGRRVLYLPDDEYREKKYKIIEEYANGGMSIMVEEFCKPIVDESAFRRFIETYEDSSNGHQKISLDDILASAINSI